MQLFGNPEGFMPLTLALADDEIYTRIIGQYKEESVKRKDDAIAKLGTGTFIAPFFVIKPTNLNNNQNTAIFVSNSAHDHNIKN
ncbi:MAG: hypothetical protein H7246_11725 [Phycisphaerae bacterium]|nr:hypothetical protein [Saprospiraceae bacterium]